MQSVQSNTLPSNDSSSAQNPVNLLQNQPITFTGAGGQQYTVIPASSLNLTQPIRHGTNIIQVPNLSIPNLQSIPVQNIPGIGNVQVIPASALQQSQLALSPIQNSQTNQSSPAPQQQQQINTVSFSNKYTTLKVSKI